MRKKKGTQVRTFDRGYPNHEVGHLMVRKSDLSKVISYCRSTTHWNIKRCLKQYPLNSGRLSHGNRYLHDSCISRQYPLSDGSLASPFPVVEGLVCETSSKSFLYSRQCSNLFIAFYSYRDAASCHYINACSGQSGTDGCILLLRPSLTCTGPQSSPALCTCPVALSIYKTVQICKLPQMMAFTG